MCCSLCVCEEQLAQELCGMWEGSSVRAANNSATVWSNCELYFNVENGRITGKGLDSAVCFMCWLRMARVFDVLNVV